MSASLEKLKHLDLYSLLGVSIDSSSSEIKSAYRKKSRHLHPDKNPHVDKQVAEEQFAQLTEAAKLLQDEQLRKAYDQVLKAREAHALRLRKLDSKRRRLRDELKAREDLEERNGTDAVSNAKGPHVSEDELRRRRIEQLRREGSEMLEEEKLKREKKIRQSHNNEQTTKTPGGNIEHKESGDCSNKLKVKWKKSEAYTEELLRRLFHKYGEVRHVITLPSSALIEFEDRMAAEMAADFEKGLPQKPLSVKRISGKK